MVRFCGIILLCFMAVAISLGNNSKISDKGHHHDDDDDDHAPSEQGNPCSKLKSDFAAGKVILSAILDDNLLLLTSDSSQVYSIPTSQLGPSEVTFPYDVKGEDAKKKWPAIGNNESAFNELLKSKGSLLLQTSTSAMMLFVNKYDDGALDALTVNLKPSVSVASRKYNIPIAIIPEKCLWISSSKNNDFYLLNHDTLMGNTGVLIKFTLDNNGILKASIKESMCTKPSANGTRVYFQGSEKCKPVFGEDLHNFRGFTDEKNVYILGPDGVYTFAFAAIRDSGNVVSFNHKNYESFLVCQKKPRIATRQSIEKSSSQDSGNKLGIIIAMVVIVLVFILGCVLAYCFLFRSKDGNSNPGNPAGKNGPGKNDIAGKLPKSSSSSIMAKGQGDGGSSTAKVTASNASNEGKSNIGSAAGSQAGGSNASSGTGSMAAGGSDYSKATKATNTSNVTSAKRPGLKKIKLKMKIKTKSGKSSSKQVKKGGSVSSKNTKAKFKSKAKSMSKKKK